MEEVSAVCEVVMTNGQEPQACCSVKSKKDMHEDLEAVVEVSGRID